MSLKIIYWALPVLLYSFWIMSFPFHSFLFIGMQGKEQLPFFFVPFVFSFFLIALLKPSIFYKLSDLAVILIILFTAVFPFIPRHVSLSLVLLGTAGAWVSAKTIILSKRSPNPYVSAGLGLALGGGVLPYLMLYLPEESWLNFFLPAAALLPIPFLSGPQLEKGTLREFKRYLPLGFALFFINGAGMGTIRAQYEQTKIIEGWELLCFALGSLIGTILIKKNRDFPLALAVIINFLSFSFLLIKVPLFTNLSICGHFMSASLMSIFFFCIIIEQEDLLKAVGYCFVVIQSGVAAGKFASIHLDKLIYPLMATGNVLMVLSVIILYFLAQRREKQAEVIREAIIADLAHLPAGINWEERFQKQLSEREKAVVEIVIKGKTYQETAEVLGITKSSVGTYMKRAYEKMGVYSKDGLIEKLALSSEEEE